MFLLFLLRRLSATARIIVGVASLIAGVTAVLFISYGAAFAVVGVIFVVSGLRAKRRERLLGVNEPGGQSRAFAQISE